MNATTKISELQPGDLALPYGTGKPPGNFICGYTSFEDLVKVIESELLYAHNVEVHDVIFVISKSNDEYVQFMNNGNLYWVVGTARVVPLC
jgi:hypothetical protein